MHLNIYFSSGKDYNLYFEAQKLSIVYLFLLVFLLRQLYPELGNVGKKELG